MKKGELHTISKFFSAELNSDELINFSNWLRTEKNKETIKEYTIANHISDLGVKKFNAEDAFEKFTSIIDSDKKEPKRILLNFQPYYKYAAIFILAIMLGFYFVNKGLDLSSNMVSVVVPIGKEKNLVLPDGTKVMINSATVLTYNKDFTNNRIVTLDGEAYFEVTKYKGKSFIVELNDQTKIKVLGTAFNIKSYSEDASIQTALFNGKIEIITNIPANENIIIDPNTVAIINKNENSIKLLANNEQTRDALAWQKDEFVFNHEYLSDIVHELSRSYGVEITIKSKELEQNYFSASFKKEVPVAQILRDLSISGSFSVNKVDATHFEVYN